MMREYFSHDYNSRNDKNMVRLSMKHGMAGIGVFWCIVEMLYENGGYLLLSEYERITFELRTKYDVIKDVIEGYNLFKNDGEKFWSETALNRIQKRDSKSNKARQSVSKRWEKYERNTNVLQTNNEGNTNKSKSKVKDIIDISQKNFYQTLIPFVDKFDKKTIREFYEYWSEPNKSGTKIRWQLEKTWDTEKRLTRWANNNFSHNGEKTESKPITYKPKP